MIRQITEDLRKHRHWLGLQDVETINEAGRTKDVQVKLLDYACGPGTVSFVSPQGPAAS